jgi:DNA-binding NtrC family response regulator
VCSEKGDALGSEKGSVLVVDDEPALRATLAKFLTHLGFAVDTAGTAPEARKKVSSGHRLALVDIRMPGEDGVAFLRHAREMYPDMGIFLMTGYPDIQTILEARKYGAAGYFRKPMDLAALEVRLRAYLDETASSSG